MEKYTPHYDLAVIKADVRPWGEGIYLNRKEHRTETRP